MWTIEKVKPVALFGLIAGMLVLMGCDKKSPDKVIPTPPPPEVSVLSMTPQSVTLTSELPGRTSPYQIAEVRPQVGGIIQERLFTEGADVKAGQVLYQIDSAPYKAALASAKANLTSAKSGKAAAEAALTRAKANAVPLRLREERYMKLVATKAVSIQEADDATAAMGQAEAEIQSAEAAILSAAAAIEGAEAALETVKINLGYTQVTAPISGRIGKSKVTTGALVTASQPSALATIQQLDPIYIDFTQSGAERLKLVQNLNSGRLKKGGGEQAPIKLLLGDGSTYPEEGVLKFSDVTVDPSTGAVILRALFPNSNQLLLPGMFVRGVVQEGVRDQAILVPQRAVTRNPEGKAMVMLAGAEDKVELRVIQVERTIGNDWLVNEGLQLGDKVIMEGIQRAGPGAKVRVVLFGADAGKASSAPPSAPATK